MIIQSSLTRRVAFDYLSRALKDTAKFNWTLRDLKNAIIKNFMARKSILVVDDEKSQREILEMISL